MMKAMNNNRFSHPFLFAVVAIIGLLNCRNSDIATTAGAQEMALVETVAVAGPSPFFIHLSDVHLDASQKRTQKHNDTGWDLWNSTKKQLTSILNRNPAPAFILYTGDLPEHCGGSSCSQYCDTTEHDHNILAMLKELEGLVSATKTPIFYLPGNNDALTGDYYSFANGQGETAFSLLGKDASIFPAVNAGEDCGLPPCTLPGQQHPLFGFYAARPMDGLRVLALNSIIFGKTYCDVDGVPALEAGQVQMNWLSGQLTQADSLGEHVYLAMHIPPGIDAYKYKTDPNNAFMWNTKMPNPWVNQFLDLCYQYQNTISGILYGHTHMEELRLLYHDGSSQFFELAVSAPGISPKNGNNPGFKLVYFDPASKELTNFTTFYSDINGRSWSSYSFNDIYGQKPGTTMLAWLQSLADTSAIEKSMAQYYKAGIPSNDNLMPGMLVKKLGK